MLCATSRDGMTSHLAIDTRYTAQADHPLSFDGMIQGASWLSTEAAHTHCALSLSYWFTDCTENSQTEMRLCRFPLLSNFVWLYINYAELPWLVAPAVEPRPVTIWSRSALVVLILVRLDVRLKWWLLYCASVSMMSGYRRCITSSPRCRHHRRRLISRGVASDVMWPLAVFGSAIFITRKRQKFMQRFFFFEGRSLTVASSFVCPLETWWFDLRHRHPSWLQFALENMRQDLDRWYYCRLDNQQDTGKIRVKTVSMKLI